MLLTPAPATLSSQLRRGHGDYLECRRAVVGLSLLATGSMGLLLAYQMGLIRRIPEPRLPAPLGRRLDGDKLARAPIAYSVLSTPDAALAMASTGVTLVLASMDGPDRARRRPWIPLALTAKAALDAAIGAFLVREQAVKFRTYCFWCLTIAASGFAALPMTLPESREAARHLRRSRVRSRRPRPRQRPVYLRS